MWKMRSLALLLCRTAEQHSHSNDDEQQAPHARFVPASVGGTRAAMLGEPVRRGKNGF